MESVEESMKLIESLRENRHGGDTKMNRESGVQHLIYTFSHKGTEEQIQIFDLAGRYSSKSGSLSKELRKINESLMSLALGFKLLRQGTSPICHSEDLPKLIFKDDVDLKIVTCLSLFNSDSKQYLEPIFNA
jgi:hypothetical protein